MTLWISWPVNSGFLPWIWLADIVSGSKNKDEPGPPGSRCLVYLDDIISFGSTFDDALASLTLIFERLRSYGLQLKSTKCHLFRSSVPFLGQIVGSRGLECDPTKIEDIHVKSWPVPDCLKSVLQFLGFVGYYRRFIPKFADLWWHWLEKTFHLCGMGTVRPPLVFSGSHLYMHRSSLFLLRPDNIFLIQTFTYVAPNSLSVRIINRWSGYIDSRTRKVWWPDSFMLCNNFIFQSYTGRGMTMEILTDSPGPLHRRADSAPDRIANRSSRFLSVLISCLTQSRPVARRMLTWSPYTRVKTGWLNSTMICLNRLLLVIFFVFRLSSERTLTVLHATHGFVRGVSLMEWGKGITSGTLLTVASS